VAPAEEVPMPAKLAEAAEFGTLETLI